MSAPDRRAKLDRDHAELSIRRQCEMLGVARSGVYRKPRPVNDNDLEAMRRIDALFTARPFFGARRIARTLSEEGFPIDRKRVRRLMRRMGIEALGPKPRTTKPAPGHKIYPYLLRDLTVDRPNQVWAADITYIPIGRGFLYLVAVIDWASRAPDTLPGGQHVRPEAYLQATAGSQRDFSLVKVLLWAQPQQR